MAARTRKANPGTTIEAVIDKARNRAGGAAALEAMLPTPTKDAALRKVGDDRYLSLMSLRIFRAGLKHSMVDARWPAFEEVFFAFEPGRITLMSDEDVERLMADARLIRHWSKLRSVRDNAAGMLAISREHSSFGSYLAAWPAADVVGLWADLAKRFVQMGGNSGPTFLRMTGKDTFLLTDDVVRALIDLGVCGRRPSTKGELAAVQMAFNGWSDTTGMPLCKLSRLLALSVG